MSTQIQHKKISRLERLARLIEQGFFVEVGRYPDTPVGKGDRLLGMDKDGHVLIARTPIQIDNSNLIL